MISFENEQTTNFCFSIFWTLNCLSKNVGITNPNQTNDNKKQCCCTECVLFLATWFFFKISVKSKNHSRENLKKNYFWKTWDLPHTKTVGHKRGTKWWCGWCQQWYCSNIEAQSTWTGIVLFSQGTPWSIHSNHSYFFLKILDFDFYHKVYFFWIFYKCTRNMVFLPTAWLNWIENEKRMFSASKFERKRK